MADKEFIMAISELLDTKLNPVKDEMLCAITSLDEKVTSLDEKVTSLDEKVTSLDEKVTSLDERVTSLEGKVTSLDERVTSLEGKVTSLDMTLENETNQYMRIIAEGHLDLTRKLDDALKVENEKEMVLIRLTCIENGLRKLREKVS